MESILKKDISHICLSHKTRIPSYISDDFVIVERFRYNLSDDELQKGIFAYREFLHNFYDYIIKNKNKIDVARGSKYDPFGTKGDRGTSNIKECFPVFFDMAMILLSLGFHGKMETKPEMRLNINGDGMSVVICPVTEKYQSLIKMNNDRRVELFGILSSLGIQFIGADFFEEIDFSKIKTFHVKSNKNKYLIIGIKLIADAATNIKDHYKMENLLNPVILHGDFQSLRSSKPVKYETDIRDFVNALQPEIKEWILNINTYLLNNGCKLIQGMGGGPPFTYVKKNMTVTFGTVCVIEADMTGCFVYPGFNHLGNPDSIVNSLPDYMFDIMKGLDISNRYEIEQCNRFSGDKEYARYTFIRNGKEYEGCRHAGLRCQYSGKKCRFTGYRFNFSDKIVRDLMMKWIAMELQI